MPRLLPRHALRAGATAVAVGLPALGAPAAGQAAEAGTSLQFTSNLDDKPLTVQPYEDSVGSVYLNARNTGSEELGDFTVTIDATALKGQMSLSADQSCVEKQQLLLVCGGKTLNGGEPLEPGGILRRPSLHFKTLAAAQPGFTGTVRVSGEAGGAPPSTARPGRWCRRSWASATTGPPPSRNGARSPATTPLP
ncbi:hypothetical protein [Streptomyces sp. NPDC054783]